MEYETTGSAGSVSEQLRGFLEAFAGTQRELLAAVEADWLSRLREAGPADCSIAAALLRKKIKSKKLVDARDALIDVLFDEP